MRARNTGAFQELLAAIVEDLNLLVHKQFALFRVETGDTVRRILFAVVFLVLGLTAAVLTLVFLGVALFEWFVMLLDSRMLAALTVAGVAAVFALILAGAGWYRLSRTSLLPRRTLASLRHTFGETSDE